MSARGTRTIDNTVTYDANFPDPLAAGNCLVTIDASGIQHDVIRQPPHYLMKAVTDHCRATVMYAAVLKTTVFIVAKSEAAKEAIKQFVEATLARLRQPPTKLVRCVITNTDLVHRDTLSAILSRFGEVRRLQMYKSLPSENKAGAEAAAVYGSFAHADLTLPCSASLPGKIAMRLSGEKVIMRITPPPRQQQQAEQSELCRDHQRGQCKRPPGHCRFRHGAQQETNCRDFQAGRCLRPAGTCKFSHAAPPGPHQPHKAQDPLRAPGTEDGPELANSQPHQRGPHLHPDRAASLARSPLGILIDASAPAAERKKPAASATEREYAAVERESKAAERASAVDAASAVESAAAPVTGSEGAIAESKSADCASAAPPTERPRAAHHTGTTAAETEGGDSHLASAEPAAAAAGDVSDRTMARAARRAATTQQKARSPRRSGSQVLGPFSPTPDMPRSAWTLRGQVGHRASRCCKPDGHVGGSDSDFEHFCSTTAPSEREDDGGDVELASEDDEDDDATGAATASEVASATATVDAVHAVDSAEGAAANSVNGTPEALGSTTAPPAAPPPQMKSSAAAPSEREEGELTGDDACGDDAEGATPSSAVRACESATPGGAGVRPAGSPAPEPAVAKLEPRGAKAARDATGRPKARSAERASTAKTSTPASAPSARRSVSAQPKAAAFGRAAKTVASRSAAALPRSPPPARRSSSRLNAKRN